MTRNELISKITESHPDLILKDVDASVRLILDAVSNHLAKGERVEIRGFGSFCLTEVPSRIGRNPRTGEKVNVPAKARVYFKPGKELRERVDTLAKG